MKKFKKLKKFLLKFKIASYVLRGRSVIYKMLMFDSALDSKGSKSVPYVEPMTEHAALVDNFFYGCTMYPYGYVKRGGVLETTKYNMETSYIE